MCRGRDDGSLPRFGNSGTKNSSHLPLLSLPIASELSPVAQFRKWRLFLQLADSIECRNTVYSLVRRAYPLTRRVPAPDSTIQYCGLLQTEPIGHTGNVVRDRTACTDLLRSRLELRGQLVWMFDKETEQISHPLLGLVTDANDVSVAVHMLVTRIVPSRPSSPPMSHAVLTRSPHGLRLGRCPSHSLASRGRTCAELRPPENRSIHARAPVASCR